MSPAGAGVLVTTVVAGGIAILRPFTAASRPFLRDVSFYMTAVFLTFTALYLGRITLPWALGEQTRAPDAPHRHPGALPSKGHPCRREPGETPRTPAAADFLCSLHRLSPVAVRACVLQPQGPGPHGVERDPHP